MKIYQVVRLFHTKANVNLKVTFKKKKIYKAPIHPRKDNWLVRILFCYCHFYVIIRENSLQQLILRY